MAEMSYREIKVILCARCHSFFMHNRWVQGKTVAEAFDLSAREGIRNAPEDVQITPVFEEEPKINPGIKRNFQIKVTTNEEEFLIPSKLEVTICPKCAKEGTQYFEGVLQLRNPSKEAIRFVRDDLKENKPKGIHLTKEVTERDGFDFYVTDQKYVQALGRRMHEKFGGDLKVTSRLFSKDTSTWKDLYRVTAYLKLPNIKVGEILHKGNRTLKVEHVGKKVHLIDTKTGKKITMSYEKLR